MKILKVYDKINRNTFERISRNGYISIKEYDNDNNYLYLVVSIKNFKLKDKCYLSCAFIKDNKTIESLDITRKYIHYRLANEKGLMVHKELISIKENKTILEVDRIYDSNNEFIEIEKHRGNKTVNFTVKDEILTKFLNILDNGQQKD